MEIRFHQSAANQQAVRAHLQEQRQRRGLSQGFWRALVAGILIGLLWHMKGGGYPKWLWVLVAAALGVQVIWALAARRGAPLALLLPEGEYFLTLTPEGVARGAPDGRIESHPWTEILALETGAGQLYFHLENDAAIAVPLTALGAEAAQNFAAEARRLWAAHPGNAGRSLPKRPPVAESAVQQALVNLGEAVRLVCFLKVDLAAFRVTWRSLGWLLLADLVWSAVMDYLEAQPMPLLSWEGVGLYAASMLMLFGWAAAVAGLMQQRASLLHLLIMAESALLLASVVSRSLQMWLEQRSNAVLMAVLGLCLLWVAVVLVRLVQRLYGRGYVAAAFLGGAYVLFSLTFALLTPDQGIYINAANVQPAGAISQQGVLRSAPPEKADQAPAPAATGDEDEDNAAEAENDEDGLAEDGDSPADRVDVEEVYYRQPEMVRQALAHVRPRRTGETGLYFVGFAGDASEHEFGNEVRYARKLLDRRFNTAGRSVVLINSYDSVDDTPLANTHNMEAVLQGMASRMDRDNDVLFLFLSSHGAQDHRLAVSFNPLEMNDLKAEKLKELLDKSGIRNRVIVVSACYSGGFLDVLKNDNTLILTASRRDHVAYGCGDVTEYTYFGEAYFVRALEHQNSFISAFDEARKRIAAREKSEGEESSDPQIHVGRNIAKVLRKLKVQPAGLKGIKVRAPQPGCPENCPGEGG